MLRRQRRRRHHPGVPVVPRVRRPRVVDALDRPHLRSSSLCPTSVLTLGRCSGTSSRKEGIPLCPLGSIEAKFRIQILVGTRLATIGDLSNLYFFAPVESLRPQTFVTNVYEFSPRLRKLHTKVLQCSLRFVLRLNKNLCRQCFVSESEENMCICIC